MKPLTKKVKDYDSSIAERKFKEWMNVLSQAALFFGEKMSRGGKRTRNYKSKIFIKRVSKNIIYG